MSEQKYHFETLQVRVGQEEADPVTDARAVPIYQTTSYVFHNAQHAADRFALKDPGYIYGRLMNPTQDVFEKRIAALEGGTAALAFASGAAAITATIQALAHEGAQGFADAIRPNTKCVFIETVGNPNADLVDIEAVAQAAHAQGVPVVIDNTFATPYLLRPIEHGADIVVHSATKFIGGHGSSLGGVIVEGGTFDWKASGRFPHLTQPNESYHGVNFVEALGPVAFVTYIRALLLRDTGAAIAPFNAFLFLQGLETLSLRVERHVSNALKVVDFLAKHPKVERVNHPSLPHHPDHAIYERYFPQGGVSIFTFDIVGGQEAAFRFIDHLKLFSLLANVADVKSLVIHPATTTHSQMNDDELAASGIGRGTIRLSIGIEHIDDLLADLTAAFDAV